MAADLYTQAKALFPYLSDELVRLYADNWATTGDTGLALMAVRSNRAVYDRYFPGNLRQDGTIRLGEMDYLSTVEGYKRRVGSFGVPADVVLGPDRLKSLIEGDVSPNEFGDKLNALYVGVITQSDFIREAYARDYGAGGLSDAAIFASALLNDGKTSPIELERRIRSAQVGGEAASYGFSLAKAESERLSSFGLDQQASRKLFAQAATDLPNLNDLLGRFNDSTDPLTASDYADAFVIQDPNKLNVLTRLLGRQAASFGPDQGQFATDESGAVTGIKAR